MLFTSYCKKHPTHSHCSAKATYYQENSLRVANQAKSLHPSFLKHWNTSQSMRTPIRKSSTHPLSRIYTHEDKPSSLKLARPDGFWNVVGRIPLKLSGGASLLISKQTSWKKPLSTEHQNRSFCCRLQRSVLAFQDGFYELSRMEEEKGTFDFATALYHPHRVPLAKLSSAGRLTYKGLPLGFHLWHLMNSIGDGKAEAASRTFLFAIGAIQPMQYWIEVENENIWTD